MRGGKWLVGGGLCGWVLAVSLSASSMALQGLSKGDKVPDIAMAGISGEGGTLSSFAGEKGLVVIYWATWNARSTGLLTFAEKELHRYEEHGLSFLAVNADRPEMTLAEISAVKAKAEELALSFPVVLDAGLRGYTGIGITGVPMTLILRPDLTLAEAYPGFPPSARDDLPDRLDAFLGILRGRPPRKPQSLPERKPKNDALQDYSLGKKMFLHSRSPSGELHGISGAGIDRLDEAIRRDPDFLRPYLLKAIVYDLAKEREKRDEVVRQIQGRDFPGARERRELGFGYLYLGMDDLAADSFQLLSSLAPEDPGVLFGQAVAAARTGDRASAKRSLDALGKQPEAARELGFDYAVLFTSAGENVPGSAEALRFSLGILLGIEKKGEKPPPADNTAVLPRGPGGLPGAPKGAAAQ